MRKKVELLAPCGSYESFLAAVNAGADAVYLGGRRFGARAYAENFSEEELIAVIRQAHLFSVKVYLTVNTLVKEREFPLLFEYLLPLYEAGLDGMIVQDMGVFRLVKQNFPECKIHASTQMTLTSSYGAAYLKSLGCERIVPARELSLQEIKAIKKDVSIEIEAFVHGAMCYCYSGQCLMSSMVGGRSGNRGRCAGPCRLPYKMAGKEGYFLSLKDMNTLDKIPELIEAGIDSFKVEGRMKKPEYVAGVISVYRKYIDEYYREVDGNPAKRNWRISLEDNRLLSKLYLRSETGNGYYDRSRGREMLTLQKPGYNEPDAALLKDLRETYVRELPKTALDFFARCRVDEPLYGEVRFSDFRTKEEICLSATGPVVQRADKRAVNEEEIRMQLVKTGGTPFFARQCEVALGENPFVPMKYVKELRRELLQKIYERYGERNPVTLRKEQADSVAGKGDDKAYALTVMVQTRQQFAAVFPMMDKMRECLIVDADLLLEDGEVRDMLLTGEASWGIKLPLILRKDDETFLKRLQAVIEEGKPKLLYCGTVDALSFAKENCYEGKLAGEASLYAWNREAALFWGKELARISLPLELDSNEIRELCLSLQETKGFLAKLEAPVYGRAPFMVTANCIKLSSGRCDRNRAQYAKLEDRMKHTFPVYTNCNHCYNVIYNELPTSYHENLWMLLEDGIRAFRIALTTESGQEAKEVLQTFRRLLASELKGEKGAKKPSVRERKTRELAGMETTQGRFRKCVE